MNVHAAATMQIIAARAVAQLARGPSTCPDQPAARLLTGAIPRRPSEWIELLLGLGGPSVVTPTPGPSPTPTPLLPTPTPKQGFGVLCVLLYDDRIGDSIRQEDEPSIPGGAISISNRAGSVSETVETAASTDPHCFGELQEGDYTITVGVPEGYNPTTATTYALELKARDETFLGFGAQASTAAELQEPEQESGGQSILLGLVGGLFLVAGVGLAVFGTRLMRGK